MQNEGKIYFPPSYTGVFSSQKIYIKNLSRIPIEYSIQVPEKYREEAYLVPRTGLLKPNEKTNLNCSFIPFKKKKYNIQIPMQIFDIINPEQELAGYYLPGSGGVNSESICPVKERIIENYKYEIIGAGGDGSLQITPEIIDFGIVNVNFNKKVYFTIQNVSDCTFFVELNFKHNKINEGSYNNI